MADRAKSADEMRDAYALSADSVLAQQRVDPTRGLSRAEVDRRIGHYGQNSLAVSEGVRWPVILARQFADVLIAILAAAAVLSLMIGEALDAAVIAAILVFNALLGFAQEWRAARAIAALKRMVSPSCNVLRDGAARAVRADSLVPGDIVLLRTGDRVPADLRLLESSEMRIDESSLTGESNPVAKQTSPTPENAPLAERSSAAWMGTAICHGSGSGVVVATGMRTEIGRIAEITRAVQRRAHPAPEEAEPTRNEIGRRRGRGLYVRGVGGLVGRQACARDVHDGCFARGGGRPRGASRGRHHHPRAGDPGDDSPARVVEEAFQPPKRSDRRPSSAPTRRDADPERDDGPRGLAPIGQLVHDRNGVRPRRRIRNHATQDWAIRQANDLDALLITGLHCNRAELAREDDRWIAIGEPTEAALLTAARKAGSHQASGLRMSCGNFHSLRRANAWRSSRKKPLARFAHVKGAPEIILERCTRILDAGVERELTTEDRSLAIEAYEAFARRGLRTLALARRKLSPELADRRRGRRVRTQLARCGGDPRPASTGGCPSHRAGSGSGNSRVDDHRRRCCHGPHDRREDRPSRPARRGRARNRHSG